MELRKEELKTKRLVLKSLSDEDQTKMIELLCDKDIGKTYMLPNFQNEEEKVLRFKALKKYTEDLSRFIYGIYLDGSLIGMINECERAGLSIELGYFIEKKHWDLGFATEALEVSIKELFRIGFEKVLAAHFSANLASARVMQKCGMVKIAKTSVVAYNGNDYLCYYYEINKEMVVN